MPDAAWIPLWRAELPERAGRIDGVDPLRLEQALAAVRAAAASLPPDVPELPRVADWPVAAETLLEALHGLRGAYDVEPPERFVERLREQLALEAGEAGRYLGGHRVANLDRFFRDLVQALDRAAGSAASVVAFLRRAGSQPREHQEGRPRAPGGKAVHVLSIHRAKGLDWDHVYLLATDRAPGRDDRRASRIERRGRDLGFVLLGWSEPGLPVLAAERAVVEAAERVRLLYVATTRARQRLVIGARDSAALDWRRAATQAALLAHRIPPEGWPERAARAPGQCVADAHGALWRLVDPPEVARAHAPAGRSALPDAAQVASDHERLQALRAAAAARAARPFSTTASAETHAREVRADEVGGDEDGAPVPGPEGDTAERRVAQAAGTAVHALLERIDWGDAAAFAPERALPALERAVTGEAPPAERAAVLARACSVWERFAAGPLAARLAALAPHVVARELPVWVAPAGDGPDDPVGFVAGAIDLLYRDPATGELVIADYKTDTVEGAALDEHAKRYAEQGEVYVRAVAAALGLSSRPRFELWFLQAGGVCTLPLA